MAIVAHQAGMAELAIAVDVGAAQVFALPLQMRELARFLAAREPDDGARSRVVALLGGHGGAGASVLAAAVAVAAPGRGVTALVVDADPWGGGLDLLLGCADLPGLRWGDLALRGGHVPSEALVAALPGRADSVAVLSAGGGPAPEIPAEALLAVLDAGRRSVGGHRRRPAAPVRSRHHGLSGGGRCGCSWWSAPRCAAAPPAGRWPTG